MRSREVLGKRTFFVIAATLLCCLAAVSSAQAAPGISVTPNFPSTAAVGDTDVPASVLVTAIGDTPLFPIFGTTYIGICRTPIHVGSGCDVIGSPWDAGITLTPSCAQTSGPLVAAPVCQVADPGVYALSSTATGAAGSACEGITFDVTVIDAATGMVRFAPLPIGNAVFLDAPPSTCRIDFTFDVLKTPVDADAAATGAQTRQFTSAGGWYEIDARKTPAPLRAVGSDVTTELCVPPTVGTPPNCLPPCEPPTTGTPPDCVPPPPVCVPPSTGTPPNCIPPCPPGSTAPECQEPSELMTARVAGARRCADAPFRVTVTVEGDSDNVSRVQFRRNKKLIKTIRRANGGSQKYVLRVKTSALKAGRTYSIASRVILRAPGSFRLGSPQLTKNLRTIKLRVADDCDPPPSKPSG